MGFLDVARDMVRHFVAAVANWLNRLTGGRLSPNTVTVVGLLAHLPIAWLIIAKHLWWAAALLVFFGLFDVLDGELARLQQRVTALGRLLDSVTDRLKEVLLYTAVAINIIAVTNRPYLAVWAVAACGLALTVSYINAWGEVVLAGSPHQGHAVNKSFRIGVGGFEIRMFVLLVGLLSGRLTLAMIAITALAAITIIERFVLVSRRLRVQD